MTSVECSGSGDSIGSMTMREEEVLPVVDRNWLRNLVMKNESEEGAWKARAVAPMVDQSDLPFRLLARRYGANLAFTPMIHARLFCEKASYRNKCFDCVRGTPKEDRPLIAQFCGFDKRYLLRAIQLIERHVDAVDLNCGCPQSIAKRGCYGAFLLERGDELVELCRHLVLQLKGSIPLSVKVRLLPSGVSDSLRLYEKLVERGGVSMLTIHGRNRFQKGRNTGRADWSAIRQVVTSLGHRIPILANGSIGTLDDVRHCLETTGADGVMTSEAILEYPAFFLRSSTRIARVRLAREYIDLCQKHPPERGGQGSGIKCVRVHLHRILHADLQVNSQLRDAVCFGQDYDSLRTAIDGVEAMQLATGHSTDDEGPSWYTRHRAEKSFLVTDKKKSNDCSFTELDDEAADCFAVMFGEEDDSREDDQYR